MVCSCAALKAACVIMNSPASLSKQPTVRPWLASQRAVHRTAPGTFEPAFLRRSARQAFHIAARNWAMHALRAGGLNTLQGGVVNMVCL